MTTAQRELRARLTIADGITLLATWAGGQYVDVSWLGVSGPVEVIEPPVEFTQAALKRALREWAREDDERPVEQLAQEVRENWASY